MTTAYDVPADALIKKMAEKLKKDTFPDPDPGSEREAC